MNKKDILFESSATYNQDIVLTILYKKMSVVEASKFLDIIFDSKLSFIPHIKYLKAKYLKALYLLKVLSNTSWGAYRALSVSSSVKIRL